MQSFCPVCISKNLGGIYLSPTHVIGKLGYKHTKSAFRQDATWQSTNEEKLYFESYTQLAKTQLNSRYQTQTIWAWQQFTCHFTKDFLVPYFTHLQITQISLTLYKGFTGTCLAVLTWLCFAVLQQVQLKKQTKITNWETDLNIIKHSTTQFQSLSINIFDKNSKSVKKW